jgi:hypothetical protein
MAITVKRAPEGGSGARQTPEPWVLPAVVTVCRTYEGTMCVSAAPKGHGRTMAPPPSGDCAILYSRV